MGNMDMYVGMLEEGGPSVALVYLYACHYMSLGVVMFRRKLATRD